MVSVTYAQESLLKFTPTGESTASVAAASRDISGIVMVPEKTIINGKEYAVTSVAEDGFEYCVQLEDVVLPEGIWEIGNNAFYFSGIKRITIPASTTMIDFFALAGCPSLESIKVSEGNSVFYLSNGILMGNTNGYIDNCIVAVPPLLSIEDYTIPNEIGLISAGAFCMNKSLKKITIPSSVKTINQHAFCSCENLKEVVWQTPSKVIPICCFQDCISLTSFVIPETVTKIEQQAFWGCNSLRSITIRKGSPIGIHRYSFGNNNSIIFDNATLYVPTGSAKYYHATDIWKNFKHIVEVEMPGIEVPENHYIALDDNQMIIGYNRREDCQSPYGLVGGAEVGTHYGYIGFTKEWMTPFKGNHIRNIRFAVKDTTFVYDVKVYIGSEQLKDDLCLQEVKSIKNGWNEVELQTPYLITGDSIFVGIQFKLRESRDYPLEWVRGGEEGSFYRYDWVDLDYQLVDWGKDYWYALCIQCLVEGDQLPENLVLYSDLSVDQKYYKPGETVTGEMRVRNMGKNPIEDFSLSAYIDGKEYPIQYYASPIAYLDDDFLSYKVPLTIALTTGKKLLTIDVQTINNKPNVYQGGIKNRQQFKYYTQSMKRDKILVELFSNMWCGHSYWGFENVGALKQQFPEATFVLYYRGAPEDICENYIDALITGFPTIYISRYAPSGASSLQENRYGSSEAISFFESAKARPAFANVNIASQYDESSRNLQVKVSGIRNEEFISVEEYTHLTIHLVEDDMVIEDRWSDETEIQDDILRGCMTDIWGDPVEWNGDSYEMNYTMQLPVTWNPEKMRIIAFLAKPFKGNNFDEMDVVNCNEAKVGENSTSGIGETIVDIQHGNREGIYNLNGQSIGSDVWRNQPKGIYIVNGKKYVKK